MFENADDNFVESKPSNVESLVELKPSIVEAFIDVKQNIVEDSVDVKLSIEVYVAMNSSIVGSRVSKL